MRVETALRAVVLFVSAILVLAACGKDNTSSTTRPAPTAAASATPAGILAVAITAQGCQPSALEAPAGKVSFAITNRAGETSEFEVLQGAKVIDERENLTPGASISLETTLAAGTYELVCGDGSTRGILTIK